MVKKTSYSTSAVSVLKSICMSPPLPDSYYNLFIDNIIRAKSKNIELYISFFKFQIHTSILKLIFEKKTFLLSTVFILLYTFDHT